VVAKTAVWEGLEPGRRVQHPVDASRTPGGSSSGDAVVVAAGAVPLGIGSDSGGSIRLPASWCGAHGFKPTAGLVPTTGHFPRVGARSDGRTQVGPLSGSVDLTERVLDVIAGPDWFDAGVVPVPADRAERGVAGLRFAVVTSESDIDASSALTAAVESAARVLGAHGGRRVKWEAPWLADALDITKRYWSRTELTGAEADAQLRDWDRFNRRYLQAAENVEILLSPVTREVAPVHRALSGEDFVFTLPASLTGSPAMSVASGVDRAGLPLAVQVVGRPWEDHRVLAVARLLTS